MGKGLFACEVKINFSQVCIGVTERASYAVDEQGIIAQRQIAKTCQEHADKEKTKPKREAGRDKPPP